MTDSGTFEIIITTKNVEHFTTNGIRYSHSIWSVLLTQDGANASMIIYSLIETAKANDIDPEKYLKYLLENRPSAD